MKNRRFNPFLQHLLGKSAGLQKMLLLAFLVLMLLPLTILGLTAYQQVSERTTQLVVAQLGLVATLKKQPA